MREAYLFAGFGRLVRARGSHEFGGVSAVISTALEVFAQAPHPVLDFVAYPRIRTATKDPRSFFPSLIPFEQDLEEANKSRPVSSEKGIEPDGVLNRRRRGLAFLFVTSAFVRPDSTERLRAIHVSVAVRTRAGSVYQRRTGRMRLHRQLVCVNMEPR
jgi:hypothetical protein